MKIASPHPEPRPPFSIKSLSGFLGIPENTLYKWRSEGKGPKGYRVGKYVRYRVEDVEAWENEQLAKESA